MGQHVAPATETTELREWVALNENMLCGTFEAARNQQYLTKLERERLAAVAQLPVGRFAPEHVKEAF